jgi:hypothetical protein
MNSITQITSFLQQREKEKGKIGGGQEGVQIQRDLRNKTTKFSV